VGASCKEKRPELRVEKERLSLSNNNLNVAVLVANLHIYFVWLALKKEINTPTAYLKLLDRKLRNAWR